MSELTARHSPIYRLVFNPDGHALVDFAGDPVERDNSYVNGANHMSQAFGSALTDELADLIDIAMAVYTADRSCPRDPRKDDRRDLHWTRRFEIVLSLRCPERWRDERVQDRLGELLWFMTEDEWSFRFFSRSGDAESKPRQGFLFSTLPDAPVTVALFSGGLDSFAGLSREIRARPRDTFVTVSGTTNHRLTGIQRGLLMGLRSRTGARIEPVEVPFGLLRGGSSYDEEEKTQRSRGFVFAILGAVTAIMAGTDRLSIYENGVGAINLPFTAGQLGTQSTRSAHPRALRDISRLVADVTGRSFEIYSPFLFLTKGQLCRSIANCGVDDLVGATISCDGFPQRVSGSDQCGTCTSCLLRRLSLCAAGLVASDRRSRYRYDVFNPNTCLSQTRVYPARAMADQVARLVRHLTTPTAWKGLSREFPQLAEVAEVVALDQKPASMVHDQIVELYRAYCDEWKQFEVHWAAQPIVHAF